MISPEVLKKVKVITESSEFLKLSISDQILYLRDQGIDFTAVSGWGNPTGPQQEAINKGSSHSIVEPKMEGEQPLSK
jgi:hypothetical protein